MYIIFCFKFEIDVAAALARLNDEILKSKVFFFISKLHDNVDYCKEQEYCRGPMIDLHRLANDPRLEMIARLYR